MTGEPNMSVTDEPLVPWREIAAQSIDHTETLEAERDELRAENERLQTENQQLKAPVTNKWGQTLTPYNHLVVQLAAARAEIERLRIELHRVAEGRRGQRERAERAEAEVERLRAEPKS
ncbi:MAG TPA: hypothetical protein VGJ60_07055 [Chloroflexota bacterium]|jgi:septal ring factor EnvC (AmiA/AmiB activator)